MIKPSALWAVALTAASTTFAAAQGVPGQHFMENWDLNEDGAVTLDEITERRDTVFVTFDANDDGALNAEEYAMFDEARANHEGGGGQGAKQRHGKGGAEMMDMSVNDENSDGEVSREEFMALADTMLSALDKNADGAVTADDFKAH